MKGYGDKSYHDGTKTTFKSAGKTAKTVRTSRLPGDGSPRKSGKKSSGSKGGMKY